MITVDMVKYSPECLSLVKGTAHTLIAGTTGSGKSVLLNSIIYALLKDGIVTGNIPCFTLIDTKWVELKQYKNLPAVSQYVTEPEDVPEALDNVINTMIKIYSEMPGKETTKGHHYVVIDELADVLSTYGVLERIIKIGRLGRAAHIHLLCCTQDPSRHTLSAQLVQNFTTRVALRCLDEIESKQIIRISGAEKLPKYGKAIALDSFGYKKIDVPLTPDEDIDELVASIAVGLKGNKSSDWLSQDLVQPLLDARKKGVEFCW